MHIAVKFSEIPGLEDIKKALLQSVQRGHVAHAQLFVGHEGSANLALALAYATYINCTDKQEGDSCGVCPSCRKYSKLIHPDLHFVVPTALVKGISKRSDATTERLLPEWREFVLQQPYGKLYNWTSFFGAENKQAMIPKEESRHIVRVLSVKAFEAEYKVMLIWLPELMQAPAANAILKVLEEPPAKTLFLLVSHKADSLLPTILSRTQIVHIPDFTDREISTYLSGQCGLPAEKAQQVAYLANGNMLEALQLSEEIDDEAGDFFKQWMRGCFQLNVKELSGAADRFGKMGKESQKNLLLYGLNIFREGMMCKYVGDEVSRLQGAQKQFVQNFSKVLNEYNVPGLVELFNSAYFYIERNANPKITFMHLSIQIYRAFRR